MGGGTWLLVAVSTPIITPTPERGSRPEQSYKMLRISASPTRIYSISSQRKDRRRKKRKRSPSTNIQENTIIFDSNYEWRFRIAKPPMPIGNWHGKFCQNVKSILMRVKGPALASWKRFDILQLSASHSTWVNSVHTSAFKRALDNLTKYPVTVTVPKDLFDISIQGRDHYGWEQRHFCDMSDQIDRRVGEE